MRYRGTSRAWVVLLICIVALAPAHAQKKPAEPQGKLVVLDRVVAIINGSVLLQSDVDDQMRFAALTPYSVPPGQNTPAKAAKRLISRTLVLQQMKEQQQFLTPITDEQVRKSLDELRKRLPACANCSTEQGWKHFLNEHGLTEAEVKQRWRQRLLILSYINLRFRSGIRITPEQVNTYYQKTLVPAFAKIHQTPPALATVSKRIKEILLQQQVNVLLNDWLTSLRDQGSVKILDPAYGQSSGKQNEDDTGGGA